DQKASFEEAVFARLKASKQPKCESAAAALISSLKDDHKGAAERLAEVFRDLGSSDDESWAQLVQQGGNQLEDWDLHRLARELYRNDLARDSALLSLRGENFRDATINRFVLNQLIAADAEEVPYLLNEWLARGASDRELLDAVVRLQHGGRLQAAATVYQALCERNPRNEGIRSGILNLIQVRLLQKAGIAYFERLLAEEYPGLGRAIIQTAGLRLAGVLDEEGDYARSLAILERLGRDGPLNKALLLRHVQALCKVGRHRDALAELEKSPFLAAASEFTIPMADLYAGLGREREAFALLERDVRSGPPRRKAASAKLREIASLTGDDAQLGVTENAPGDDPPSGEKTPVTDRDWEKALTEIENPASSQEERFRALRNFLSVQRTLPENLKTAQLARLRRIVAKNPGLLPEYYALRRELAERSGSTNNLIAELYAEWNSGRGPSQAGEMIVYLLMPKSRFDEIGALLDVYLTPTHFNERAWDQIGHRLLAAGQYSLVVRTYSELTQRVPGNLARSLLLAQALYWTGQAAQADAMVSPIKRVAPFDPSKNVDIAEFYLDTGRLAEAQPYLTSAPSDARAGAAWIEAAELSVTQGDFTAARDCIRRAMKTPQVIPVRAIADFYWKSGTLSRLDPRTNEFELGARQFRSLQMEVAQKLVEANDIEQAWSWIEGTRGLLDDAQGRSLLQSVESSDWDRAAALWEASESPLWDTRCGMAQFFLRRAETGSQSPAAAMKDLARAHELHPGSFVIAQAYVDKLLETDEQEAARKVLQQVIEAYSEPADRRAARQLLASLELSPALPKGD
ncbi:MAG TPA: tetratricopeptide repeat protein, partial [Terrimicrobiaceae bacterium]|nr:tetratricopeptide repeat protein [Terrimicrobiaceae bacterium]